VVAGFSAFGAFWGTWGATLPGVQAHAGVDSGQLGVALLFIGAGALMSMRFAGVAFDRIGTIGLPASLALFGVAGVLPAIAGSAATLTVAMLALGAASGAVDVAINAEGTRYEASSDRPIMSLAHGTFSACVVAGSLGAAALRGGGRGPGLVLAVVGGAIVALAVAISRAPASGGRRAPAHLSLRRLPRPLVLLGGLCALAYFVESAWQSWGAIHLERDLHASTGIAAVTPAVFAGAAAVGRAASQTLLRWLDEIVLLRSGAALGAAGTVTGALAPSRPLALVGIAVAGAGISVCAPNLLSMAGRHADDARRASAVSIVTTIAYAGFVIGPAIVGLVAQAMTLETSLAAAAGVAVLLAAIAGTARQ
jgi:predicted MFS family arabinose efflux permease